MGISFHEHEDPPELTPLGKSKVQLDRTKNRNKESGPFKLFYSFPLIIPRGLNTSVLSSRVQLPSIC